MVDVKFLALGGQDEKGKNLFIIEVENDLYVFDCGSKLPEKGILGIDVIIPNFQYLKDNKSRIKGIFISNPSSANSGAINYILREVNTNIYCNWLTTFFLRYKSLRFKLKNRDSNFKLIKEKDIINFGSAKIEVFATTCSFPQSFGFVIKTTSGNIVYASDYIMDGKEKTNYKTDYHHLTTIADQGVLAFISDSQNANRNAFTSPKHKITPHIENLMKEKKRLVIALFEEDVYKMSEVFAETIKNGRKIAIYGRTWSDILDQPEVKTELNFTASDIISINEYMKSENGVLIISGTEEILYSRLAKIASGNDESMEFTENDIVILATPPAPGVEKRHAEVLDELARTNARVVSLQEKNMWAMKASYEDIKLMTNILKPKFFFPVKALFKEMLKASEAAIEAGVVLDNIRLLENGQIWKLTNSKDFVFTTDVVTNGDVYVDGIGIGDVGSVVLNERKQLSTDGAVIVGLAIDKKTKELVSLIDIQMRGVIYIKEESTIFDLLRKQLTDIISKFGILFKETPTKFDVAALKKELIQKIRYTVKNEIGKQPIVLSSIIEL